MHPLLALAAACWIFAAACPVGVLCAWAFPPPYPVDPKGTKRVFILGSASSLTGIALLLAWAVIIPQGA